MNLDIDPTDVAINADMTATGQIDITASNNITIAAVTVRSDTDGNGGALSITADDDNSGAGDLTAVNGSVLRGHTVTLTGFNTVTDVVTSNVGTLTIIARNDVTINDATTATAGQVTVSAAETSSSTRTSRPPQPPSSLRTVMPVPRARFPELRGQSRVHRSS